MERRRCRGGARQYRARFIDLLTGSRNNSGENIWRQVVGRETNQIDAGNRPSTHGIDVAQCIRRTYLTKQHRIVKWRGDEIRRDHDGEFIRQAIDPRIVVGFIPDNEIGIHNRWQITEERLQLDRADLRRSTAGFRQSC